MSATVVLPAIASEDIEDAIAREEKSEYIIQDLYIVEDFAVAIPANWKVITKYDGKATKPSPTPTLFSAIDFNSGAVISIVKEEACNVEEYARATFEKQKRNAKKRCDFALRNTEDGSSPNDLFSVETYEKDASKLLIRHDDRDNAVLRAVSKIEESKLTKTGRTRQFSSSNGEIELTSSSLLELRASTTIPTGGTYTDTMGLEQPNTIQRKVLAKAVATTKRVTRKPSEDISAETAPTPLPSSAESTVLTTEAEETPIEDIDTKSELVATTTENSSETTIDNSENETPETSLDTGSISSSSDNSLTAAGTSEPDTEALGSTSDMEETVVAEAPETTKEESETDSSGVESAPASIEVTTAAIPPSVMEDEVDAAAPTTASLAESEPETTSVSTESTQDMNTPMTAMMAMIASLDEEPTLSNDSVDSSSIDTIVESAVTKATETVLEAANEMILESVAEEAKEIGSETTDSAIDSAENQSTLAIEKEGSSSDSDSSDANLLANAAEPIPDASSTNTDIETRTTVLSIWLSAPLDEWQKPVMGTRLNQIWESVDYVDNSSEDDDVSVNKQLLLLNNKGLR